jgi:hypothetical protein
MNSAIANKELTDEENLPTTEYAPPKAVSGKFSGLGTGVLLAGGAVVGCFALALWNRKALMSLVKNRGLQQVPTDADKAEDTDGIY